MNYKHSFGQKYDDEELRAMAICTFDAINSGQQHAAELIMTISAYTRLHPNIVVEKIREIARVQL